MTEEEKKLRKTIFEKIEQKYKLHFRDHFIIGMAITETLTEKDTEIAKLKEQIGTKDILIKELQEQKVYWKESSFNWRHKFFKKGSIKRLVQKDKQLTEAKELLKWWVSHCGNHDLHYAKKTEQFLNEK